MVETLTESAGKVDDNREAFQVILNFPVGLAVR